MGVIGMRHFILGILVAFFFVGCAHQHQINIGDITLNNNNQPMLKNQEYYMSFTQEYYDNKMYPLSEYCDEQRTYLADDKFSTETYLKISNERTKQSRVGKYPVWFLLNDDVSNISCIRKSTNFINSEPFVVNASDALAVKLFQKNEAATTVPVNELGVLIDFVSLVVPRTANFLLKANNIIKDPVTQNYLEVMDESFRRGDLDGTKSRGFKTDVRSIKVKFYVPMEKGGKKELGYILLKPKYRNTLSTVNSVNGIPNFRFIYNSTDPQIEDLMQYELEKRRIRVQVVVDNFRQVANEHVIEALSSLNTHLVNHFTRFDRALVLNLSLRQSGLYRDFLQGIKSKDVGRLRQYLALFESEQNPLADLMEELKVTKCEYYTLITKAKRLIKQSDELRQREHTEAQRVENERLRVEEEREGIKNFFTPVANWKYLPQMFDEKVEIVKTTGESLTLDSLTVHYNKQENVKAYGCFVDLQKLITVQFNRNSQKRGLTIQDYLIHPSYTKGIKYDYMAISINKNNNIDTLFYKLSKEGSLQIEKILIDSSNLFINKDKIKAIIQGKRAFGCSENIRRAF